MQQVKHLVVFSSYCKNLHSDPLLSGIYQTPLVQFLNGSVREFYKEQVLNIKTCRC